MTPQVTYLIESLPWTLVGFLAGCLVTLKLRPPPTPGAHQEPLMPAPTAPRRRRVTLVHLIGLVVIGLTVLSTVQTAIQTRETERQRQAAERLTQCLVVYANATADAIEVRSKAGQEAAVATVLMWRSVFGSPPTDEGRAAARRTFEDYLTKQETAIKTQQANPYPPAPRTLCPDSAR